MKCGEFEEQILLEQSGELDGHARSLLEKHRERCSRCRAYSGATAALVGAARAALSDEPGAEVLRRIRTQAARRTNSPVILLYRPGVQALACAAALLLVVGGWRLLAPRSGTIEVRDMHAIITMMMDEEMIAEQRDAGAQPTDLRALAELLLRMEESAVNGSADQEDQLWELDSRAPRSRSSVGAPPRRYG